MDSREPLCLDLDAARGLRAKLDPPRSAALARTLKVLGDPTRLLIAQALRESELCGCDLGWMTGCSDKLVSHHLGRLREAGFVAGRREGKVVFASLTPSGRALVDAVSELVACVA